MTDTQAMCDWLRGKIVALQADVARLSLGYCLAHQPLGDSEESCGACEAVHQAERVEKAEADLAKVTEERDGALLRWGTARDDKETADRIAVAAREQAEKLARALSRVRHHDVSAYVAMLAQAALDEYRSTK